MNLITVSLVVVLSLFLKNAQTMNLFNPKDPEMQEHMKHCSKEFGIDLDSLMTGLTKEQIKKLYENHDFQCFTHCIIKRLGLMSGDNEHDYELFKELSKLENDDNKEKFLGCLSENTQEDVCERGAQIKLCVKKLYYVPS